MKRVLNLFCILGAVAALSGCKSHDFWGNYSSGTSRYTLCLEKKNSYGQLLKGRAPNEKIAWKGRVELENDFLGEACNVRFEVHDYGASFKKRVVRIKRNPDRDRYEIWLHAETDKPVAIGKDFQKE